MISLTWEQVRAWRLERHFLASRLKQPQFTRAAERVLGVQAQVLSAAELSIGARVDGLKRVDVQKALWQDRTLVKIWAMRGTIHVFAAEDLPMIVAARCANGSRFRLHDFLQLGFTEAQYDQFVRTVPEVLSDAGDVPMPREALAEGVAQRMKSPEVKKALLGSSWGTLWKPSTFRGELCFGPGEGRAGTFVNPRKWLNEWKEWEPQEAQREITRRYLQAYGPASPSDFSFWWDGGGRTYGRKMFEMLGDELVEVDVEGWKAMALKTTLESLENAKMESGTNNLRLVPMFDVYVLTQARNLESLLDMEHKSKVFRPAAWISAAVLVNGKIEGVWVYETRKGQTVVSVRMFATPGSKVSREIRNGVEAEAERLAGFFDTSVSVEFMDAA